MFNKIYLSESIGDDKYGVTDKTLRAFKETVKSSPEGSHFYLCGSPDSNDVRDVFNCSESKDNFGDIVKAPYSFVFYTDNSGGEIELTEEQFKVGVPNKTEHWKNLVKVFDFVVENQSYFFYFEVGQLIMNTEKKDRPDYNVKIVKAFISEYCTLKMGYKEHSQENLEHNLKKGSKDYESIEVEAEGGEKLDIWTLDVNAPNFYFGIETVNSEYVRARYITEGKNKGKIQIPNQNLDYCSGAVRALEANHMGSYERLNAKRFLKINMTNYELEPSKKITLKMSPRYKRLDEEGKEYFVEATYDNFDMIHSTDLIIFMMGETRYKEQKMKSLIAKFRGKFPKLYFENLGKGRKRKGEHKTFYNNLSKSIRLLNKGETAQGVETEIELIKFRYDLPEDAEYENILNFCKELMSGLKLDRNPNFFPDFIPRDLPSLPTEN